MVTKEGQSITITLPEFKPKRLGGYAALAGATVLATSYILGGGVFAPSQNPDQSPMPTPSGETKTNLKVAANSTANPVETTSPSMSSQVVESQAPEATTQVNTETAGYTIIKQDSIPEGSSLELPANSVIVGDTPSIDGQNWTDDKENTGLVTILGQSAVVEAGINYKIDYYVVENLEQAKKLAKKQQDDQLKRGCVNKAGCQESDVLMFPGQAQGQQTSLDLSGY